MCAYADEPKRAKSDLLSEQSDTAVTIVTVADIVNSYDLIMKQKPSERRLAENEVVFRQLNEQIEKSIDEVNQMAAEAGQPEYMIKHGPGDPPLHFYCECSDIDCVERVQLNLHEYNQIHEKRDRFVVLHGHETEEVERVIKIEPKYLVVKKHIKPPETVGAIFTTGD